MKVIVTLSLFFAFSYTLLAQEIAAIDQADKVVTNILAKEATFDTSLHNIEALHNKKVDFAIVNSNQAYAMKKSMPELRSIAALYPKMLAFITRKDANITSISQLKKKKLHINVTCEGTDTLCHLIFPTLNIPNDYNVSTFIQAKKELNDGNIDGLFALVGHPDSHIIQLNKELNISFVPLFGKKFDQLNTDYPYILKGGMPKGIYTGVEKDIKSIGVKTLLLTREDVNESSVFNLTNQLLDNLQTIKTKNAIYRGISKKTLLEGLVLPQHKGALKAFNKH